VTNVTRVRNRPSLKNRKPKVDKCLRLGRGDKTRRGARILTSGGRRDSGHKADQETGRIHDKSQTNRLQQDTERPVIRTKKWGEKKCGTKEDTSGRKQKVKSGKKPPKVNWTLSARTKAKSDGLAAHLSHQGRAGGRKGKMKRLKGEDGFRDENLRGGLLSRREDAVR